MLWVEVCLAEGTHAVRLTSPRPDLPAALRQSAAKWLPDGLPNRLGRFREGTQSAAGSRSRECVGEAPGLDPVGGVFSGRAQAAAKENGATRVSLHGRCR